MTHLNKFCKLHTEKHRISESGLSRLTYWLTDLLHGAETFLRS